MTEPAAAHRHRQAARRDQRREDQTDFVPDSASAVLVNLGAGNVAQVCDEVEWSWRGITPSP